MFELKCQQVLLANLTTRVEKHGDEDKPAASLKCEITLANTVLDQFNPKLLKAFYENNEAKAQAELIKNDMFPDLKFLPLKPISWDEEYENNRVLLVNDLNPEEVNFILADCTLKGFSFTMKDGGSVTVSFTINCDPSGEAIGWLYNMQKHNILITIEAPEALKVEQMEADLDDVA